MIRRLLVVGYLLCCKVFGEDPACVNRFEYEHGVLKKLVYLEQFKADATERIAALERQLLGEQTPSTLSSSTYVHWGMKTCPSVKGTTMVYSGQAAGGYYNQAGSSEYICLPNDPEYDKHNNLLDDQRSLMYGAEYETYGNPPALSDLWDYEVPCSVCLVREKTTLMIPGRTSCYSGWTKEYHGYLMGEAHMQQGKGYVCMDKHAEPWNTTTKANLDGAVFYFVEGRCGSLKCPPYVNGAELACVVCSR